MTTFGSVCSGIEAASVAWHPLGWHAAWLAEIEPFPSAVLAHHYPDVPNLGDMTKLPERISSGEVPAPDVFCGGTPCQAFSVAGLRKSLDDARGNLSLIFCEIANAIDTVRAGRGDPPAIIFWENVPGVLSTKDNAFGCFLAGLAGEDKPLEPPGSGWANAGYVSGPQRTIAWRTLDAQYFGLAQRRRRVFVVASARNDFDPAAVLFEWGGVRRDIAPSRETWQSIAPAVTAGAPNGGAAHGARSGSAKEGLIVPVQPIPFDTTQITSAANYSSPKAGDACHPLAAGAHPPAIAQPYTVANGLTARMHKGINSTLDEGQTPVVVPVAYTTKLHNTQSNQAGKFYEEYATSLNANSPPPAVFQPIAFSAKDHGADATADLSPTLRAMGHADSHANGGGQMAVAFQDRFRGDDGRGYGRVPPVSVEQIGTLETVKPWNVAHPIAFHPTQDPISSTDGTTHGLGCGSSGGQASIAVAFAQNSRDEVRIMQVAGALAAKPEMKQQTYLAQPMFLHVNKGRPNGRQSAHEEMVSVKHIVETLTTDGHAKSAIAQPYTLAIRGRGDTHQLEYRQDGTANALLTPNGGRGGIGVGAVAFQPRHYADRVRMGGEPSEICHTLSAAAGQGDSSPHVATAMAVRRLTPVECERLMGFPDNYTAIPWRKKPASECPDGPRYKSLGNSWATPVVSWIGRRIQEHLEGKL